MRTNMKRAEMRSLAIAAAPSAVHAYLADGVNLPAWAPGFAPGIRADAGGGWIVTRGELEFPLEVLSEPRSRTVDFVAPDDHARGLFARVLPNGAGSELLFAILFTPDTPAEVIAAQLLTLETELAAVRDACER